MRLFAFRCDPDKKPYNRLPCFISNCPTVPPARRRPNKRKNVQPTHTNRFPTAATEQPFWNPGRWGPCSASCGLGTKLRRVVCQTRTGGVVDNSMCVQGRRPSEAHGCKLRECRWRPASRTGSLWSLTKRQRWSPRRSIANEAIAFLYPGRDKLVEIDSGGLRSRGSCGSDADPLPNTVDKRLLHVSCDFVEMPWSFACNHKRITSHPFSTQRSLYLSKSGETWPKETSVCLKCEWAFSCSVSIAASFVFCGLVEYTFSQFSLQMPIRKKCLSDTKRRAIWGHLGPRVVYVLGVASLTSLWRLVVCREICPTGWDWRMA